MDTITFKPDRKDGMRDPEMARLEIGKELLNNENIDGKTELNDKEIFAFAAVEAFKARVYTPRWVDVPYMSKEEASQRRQALLKSLGDSKLQQDPEALKLYLSAIGPALRELDVVLDPLAEEIEENGVKRIRRTTPPVVYDVLADRVKKMRVSKDRKSRWEILNLVVVEKALNGLKELIGRMGATETPTGIMDRIKGMF